MKRTPAIQWIFVILALQGVLVFCNKASDDIPNVVIPGTWQRTISADSLDYRVRLSFDSSGLLYWTMIDSIPGHTSSVVSFSATYSKIVIFNDPECGGNGYYSYSASDSILNIALLEDHCPPRASSFSGIWTRIRHTKKDKMP